MSGYYTKKRYDDCYNKEFITQQVKPGNYSLFQGFSENNYKCSVLNGPRANKNRATGELGNSDISFRTDIESQLYNLDVPDSRCITLKTMEEKNKRLKNIVDQKTINYCYCNNNQDTIYSRLDIPVNNFKSVYINRYDFPIVNPKEFVYYGVPNTDQINNERFGINTQLRAKDNINKPNMKPFSVIL